MTGLKVAGSLAWRSLTREYAGVAARRRAASTEASASSSGAAYRVAASCGALDGRQALSGGGGRIAPARDDKSIEAGDGQSLGEGVWQNRC